MWNLNYRVDVTSWVNTCLCLRLCCRVRATSSVIVSVWTYVWVRDFAYDRLRLAVSHYDMCSFLARSVTHIHGLVGMVLCVFENAPHLWAHVTRAAIDSALRRCTIEVTDHWLHRRHLPAICLRRRARSVVAISNFIFLCIQSEIFQCFTIEIPDLAQQLTHMSPWTCSATPTIRIHPEYSVQGGCDADSAPGSDPQ